MIDIAFLFCTFIFNLFDIFCFGVYKDIGESDLFYFAIASISLCFNYSKLRGLSQHF
jgi:hypothetical protein